MCHKSPKKKKNHPIPKFFFNFENIFELVTLVLPKNNKIISCKKTKE